MATSTHELFLEAEFKLNINIEPIDGYSMADYEFDIAVCSNNPKKVVTFSKIGVGDNAVLSDNLFKVDNDNYIVSVDTSDIGYGYVRCQITTYIPDETMSDKIRTEIIIIETDIYINK